MKITIQENISLKEKNWFRTGGKARFFCEPNTSDEFQQALKYSEVHALPLFILGDGANVLINDEGFNGLVIKPQLKKILQKQNSDNTTLVTAEAGVLINELIEWCLNNNLIGLEEFSNIPGTVGGALYINLHYFQFFISHFLISATIINRKTQEMSEVDQTWFQFGYDHSSLMNDEYYLVNATFKVAQANNLQIAHARGRSIEITRHRMSRYPQGYTCGSFFRNFHENEVTLISNHKKMIFVAYYLDKIGVKGMLTHGDAQVSYQHANMIVNNGNATSNDIIILARKMQELVYKKFKIIPQPECRLIGFNHHPLL